MKKVILTILILGVLILGGCVATAQHKSFYFENKGNMILNYGVCENLMKSYCENKFNCVGYTISDLVCEDDMCYCY